MAYKSKVTEGKYKSVKILLASGATHKECAESMSLSAFTIGLINRSESYEEYKNQAYLHSSYARKKMKKEAEEKAREVEEKARKEAAAPVVTEERSEKQEQPSQVVEYRQNVTIQATHYMMEEMRKTNELLTFISNKLAFIVEELTR